MTKHAIIVVAGLLTAALGVGCQSLIDLEERTYDSTATGGNASAAMGGTSGTTGGAVTGEGGEAGGEAVSPCEEYCTLVMDSCVNECPPTNPTCPDDLSLYSSFSVCMGVCATFEPGDLEERNPSGNTLACRLKQAQFAGSLDGDKIEHCAQAGPGGNGVCGDDCESYCDLMNEFCAEDFPDTVDENCLANCAGISPERRIVATTLFGAARHHDGDNLQCRLVHASSAAIDPVTHCWHSSLAPKPLMGAPNPCADPEGTPPSCDAYCRLVQVTCQDELAQFESEAQCRKACGALAPGDALDAGGNTVGCRRTHSYNAMLSAPETHCPHAGPGGFGVCGTNCASYCTLLAGACSDDFTSEEDCLAECADIPGVDESYSVSTVAEGDNFGCRLRAVVRAFDEPELCADALGGGDCQD